MNKNSFGYKIYILNLNVFMHYKKNIFLMKHAIYLIFIKNNHILILFFRSKIITNGVNNTYISICIFNYSLCGKDPYLVLASQLLVTPRSQMCSRGGAEGDMDVSVYLPQHMGLYVLKINRIPFLHNEVSDLILNTIFFLKVCTMTSFPINLFLEEGGTRIGEWGDQWGRQGK